MEDKTKCTLIIPDEHEQECTKYVKEHSLEDICFKVKKLDGVNEDFKTFVDELLEEEINYKDVKEIIKKEVTSNLCYHIIPSIIIVLLLIYTRFPLLFNSIMTAGLIIGFIDMAFRFYTLSDLFKMKKRFKENIESMSMLFSEAILFDRKDLIESFNKFLLPESKMGDEVIKVVSK